MFNNRGWRMVPPLLAVALLAAACGSDEDDAVEAQPDATTESDEASEDSESSDGAEVVWTETPQGNSEDWVVWDTSTCSYEPADSHPETWVPEARRGTDSFLLGYAAQDTVNAVNITTNEGMTESAEEAGVELAIADYKFPSTSEPIEAARSIVARDPSAVVSLQGLTDLLDSVNDVYLGACIPVIQVATSAPRTVYFGPTNDGMGELQGQRLIEFANSQGWTAENTTLITTFYSPAGPDVALRASVCSDMIKDAFPGIETVEHDTTSTDGIELQSNFTSVLTSNPDAENILVCTVADLWALANAEALSVAGRAQTAAVTGVNGGQEILDAISEGDSALVGTVDLGAAIWGRYLIPLSQDIVAGSPVPSEVFAPIVMLPEELPTR